MAGGDRTSKTSGGKSASASPQRSKLLIIDGNYLANRSYHALPKSLRTTQGRPAGAVVGFATAMLQLYESENPRAVLVGWDTLDASTYRKRAFPAYQSGRIFDKDLLEQLEVLRNFVSILGLAGARRAGYEADDFLAAAAAHEERNHRKSVIVTGDRDSFQLASDLTTILYAVRGAGWTPVGPEEVRSRYGVEPRQVPDFIALRGDPSDRLPGAKGVGPKTAAALIHQYGDLDGILKAGRFREQAADLQLFRKIATMDRSAPLPSLRDQTPKWREAAELASDWGLEQLSERLGALAVAQSRSSRSASLLSAPLKVATFNVNNVNRHLASLLGWLNTSQPDIACLQELKATADDFPAEALAEAGYKAVWEGQRTWNGVAILSKGVEPVTIRTTLPGDAADRQARYIEAAVRGVIIASLYLPNGNPQPGPKFDYKLAWSERLQRHAKALLSYDVPVILAGDFNVAPTDLDIYPTRSFDNNALVHPASRSAFTDLLALGWCDALRAIHPEQRLYTFWRYMRQSFERDAGLRLDHLLLSPQLAPLVTSAGVDRRVRDGPDVSDHAPAWIQLRKGRLAKSA